MSRLLSTTLAVAFLPLLATAQSFQEPVLVSASDIFEEPYRYAGLVLADGKDPASGCLVAEGVFMTAGHVVYDEAAKVWIPASSVRFLPRYYKTGDPATSGSFSFPAAGMQRWTSWYPHRRFYLDEDLPSMETYNVDLAVGWLAPSIKHATISNYPELNVDAEGEAGIMRDDRNKLIVGYQMESPVPSGSRGLMHEIPASNYFTQWEGLEGYFEYDYEFWGGPLWMAMYSILDVVSYGGSSGSPVFSEDDMGNWVMTGVLVDQPTSGVVLVRGIDDKAYEWVRRAVGDRGTERTRQVRDLRPETVGPNSAYLKWSDISGDEAGYEVFRKYAGRWSRIASLPANTTSYVDKNVEPGNVYHYEVQPYTADGNRPPKSQSIQVRTGGNYTAAADFLDQPYLHFGNSGNSSWYVDKQNRLRSGAVRANSYSSLNLDIIGPGRLSFRWGVSSEANSAYMEAGDEIFDALYLYLDDQPVMDGEEVTFISGNVSSRSLDLDVPAGAHTIEFRYGKNAYFEELQDAAFMHELDWIPDAGNAFPVFGAFQDTDPDWIGSEWFGSMYSPEEFWALHIELGWLYLLKGDSSGHLYAQSYYPSLGMICTHPDWYPYLYQLETGHWLYYYPQSGTRGHGATFWDLETNQALVLP